MEGDSVGVQSFRKLFGELDSRWERERDARVKKTLRFAFAVEELVASSLARSVRSGNESTRRIRAEKSGTSGNLGQLARTIHACSALFALFTLFIVCGHTPWLIFDGAMRFYSRRPSRSRLTVRSSFLLLFSREISLAGLCRWSRWIEADLLNKLYIAQIAPRPFSLHWNCGFREPGFS